MEAKVKLFIKKDNEDCIRMENILKELGVRLEVIETWKTKYKKQCKEFCVNERNVPFMFFISTDEKKTLYSTNVNNFSKREIKGIICSLKDHYGKNIFGQIENKGENNDVD